MFRGDSQNLHGPPGALCLVANDLDPTPGGGGLGAHHWLTAHALAGQGWRVHVLYCGEAAEAKLLAASLQEAGVGFSRLDDLPAPAHLEVRTEDPLGFLVRSDRVRFALEELHRRHRFNLIEFAEWGALGFRTLQARRAGLAFGGVRIIVKLHGSTQWRREQDLLWMTHPHELERDYCERYAFEQADFQVSSSPTMLEYARSAGWQIREDAWVIDPHEPYSFSRGLRNRAVPRNVATRESAEPLVTVAVPYYNLPAFLPEALASLASQTYPHLEVLVINDGSTDTEAIRVFEEQRPLYPRFRFLTQENSGIGAARNRGLREARGEFFMPMDADNVAFPHMVESFVNALGRNPELAAMTCYYLAFEKSEDRARGKFIYACRPTGGPRVMSAFRNIYGDANAIFRTNCFRAVGGYETDRDTSWEDWEAFIKLVNAGQQVDVIPAHLFAYRHRESGFSRVTGNFQNHQRVLRQAIEMDNLPRAERTALWTALVSLQKRNDELQNQVCFLQLSLTCLRYRFADLLYTAASKLPFVTRGLKQLFESSRRTLQRITRKAG